MSLKPASIGIVFNKDKTQVLLVKRKDIPVWVLPGGGIDQNETPEAAAGREVFEETGYRVLIERQSGEYYPVNRLTALTFVYVCKIVEGSPTLSAETVAVDFFSVDNLPSSFFIVHRDWLDDALTHSEPVKKELIQVTYAAVLAYLFRHPMLLLQYIWNRFFKNI